MPLLQDLLPRRHITGIEPFNELPVDAEIWREAHEHHHLHRLLHAAVSHRPGVVWGLEVVASSKTNGAITVAPGVGVDSSGQTVVLIDPVSLTLEERGQIHITLSFLRTFDRASATPVGGGQQYFRLVEGRDLTATKDLGSGPLLELARIYRTTPDAPVRDAVRPFDPGNNEINLLGRVSAFPFCFADAPIGELAYVPLTDPTGWKPNRAGLVNLVRESAGHGFHCAFLGPVNLRDASARSTPVLLYAGGKNGFQGLGSEDSDGLRAFLDGGGVLLGESTHENKEADGFFASFNDLARQVGANLAPLPADHPLYASRFVFAPNQPPLGSAPAAALTASKGALLGDDAQGIYWSRYNWGGAWQGQIASTESDSPRERIRASLEWGMNFLAFAAARRRRKELSRFV